ncbi:MAG TPA: hypothetical protein VM802_14805 [Chitinophaga sp.]|uniref:hypothetical protein n=1 Tax=Chitinophaga sp. TaxID=1869181 RepID=UPI002BDA4506|nr:hypothetical protein [Chitinophaga sp.]HVI46142.1 hypothetical protein [Chitinophaga sp.]
MVLIISEVADNVTDTVMEHIAASGNYCFRINATDNIIVATYKGNDFHIEVEGKGSMHISSVRKIWYRRGYIDMPALHPAYRETKSSLYRNWMTVLGHMFECAGEKTLGSFWLEFRQNKLADLYRAKAAGLRTPLTLVTSSKQEVLEFMKLAGTVIVKPLNSVDTDLHDALFGRGTQVVLPEVLDRLPHPLPVCFFQQLIEKEFDLRVFYLKGALYTVAIFSQRNDVTRVDFRNYDEQRPNRMIPFRLPADVEDLVIRFMKGKGLDTGSLDLILTPKGEYVFLEVNPSGHFEWISNGCNLNLEQLIANELIS